MGEYLGQNFLVDSSVKHYIAEKIQKLYGEFSCESLVEIGPGKGALTKLIKGISKHFFVIEKDDTLVHNNKLISEGVQDVNVILSDVLEVDVIKLLDDKKLVPSKTLVVGNLPYYITSPILRKFFTPRGIEGKGDDLVFPGGIFLVQKEVAEKIMTSAKKKSFLWRLLNFGYEVSYLKSVPGNAFSPAPKVTSAVIGLKKKLQVPKVPFAKLEEFLDNFAPFSRKTLGAINKMNIKKSRKAAGDSEYNFIIPNGLESKRLEELTWDELMKIIS